MASNYIYLQPKYVSKFMCDGKICPANCCARDWRIVIDAETYEKYFQLESSQHELTKNLEPNTDGEGFLIKQSENNHCPFETADGLCKIQLKYGEKFLSQTCMCYPRQLFNFGEIIERTLTPTCPLAAELILNSERLEFEFAPLDLPDWAQGQLIISDSKVPQKIFPCIIDLQLTAVSILQERRLKIDERLIVLGYYLFQAEKIIDLGELHLLETLNKIYTSEEFFLQEIPQLLDSINFQVTEFVQTIFELLKKIYGDENILKTEGNQKYIDQLCKVFGVNFFCDELNFDELAENYSDLEDIRKIFIENYSAAWENYLVNDFFGGVYPYKISGKIQHNFAVFVTGYKILELIALSMTVLSRENEKILRQEIFSMITDMSMDLNHNENFLSALADNLEDKADISIFMRATLSAV